eukprot:23520-Pelagococcus_subviridis.AAC.1
MKKTFLTEAPPSRSSVVMYTYCILAEKPTTRALTTRRQSTPSKSPPHGCDSVLDRSCETSASPAYPLSSLSPPSSSS